MIKCIKWYNGDLVKVTEGNGYLSDCLGCIFYNNKCDVFSYDNNTPCHVTINKLLGASVYTNYYSVRYLTIPISLYVSMYSKNLRK